MIQNGRYNIRRICVGSDEIEEVYYGSEKVWEGLRGYWVHKDTGVKTYFTFGDVSIGDGVMGRPSWYLDCSEVKIPYRIIGLEARCFYNCSALTSINIPESVTNLGNFCFNGCASLTSIYSFGSTAPLGNGLFGANSGNWTGRNTYNQGVNRLYVPQGATGYDAGDWLDPLQSALKCGFTISYTL